jgi:hypothetical protein
MKSIRERMQLRLQPGVGSILRNSRRVVYGSNEKKNQGGNTHNTGRFRKYTGLKPNQSRKMEDLLPPGI